MPDEQPTVLWVSGAPNFGKSHVSKLLTKESGVVSFRTDNFIVRLPDWCEDDQLLKEWNKHGRRNIGAFLDRVVRHKKTGYLAGKMLDKTHGFTPGPGLSIIEGYMPISIQDKVMATLETRGCFVWVVVRLGGRKGDAAFYFGGSSVG